MFISHAMHGIYQFTYGSKKSAEREATNPTRKQIISMMENNTSHMKSKINTDDVENGPEKTKTKTKYSCYYQRALH